MSVKPWYQTRSVASSKLVPRCEAWVSVNTSTGGDLAPSTISLKVRALHVQQFLDVSGTFTVDEARQLSRAFAEAADAAEAHDAQC